MKIKTFLSGYKTALSCIAICLVLGSLPAKVAGQPIAIEESSNAVVAILTRYDVKDGYEKTFRKVLENYVASALNNENNIMAEAYSEQENPAIMWIIERWNSKEELDKHRKTKPFDTIIALSEEGLVKPAQRIYVKDLEPVSKKQWRIVGERNDKPLTIMLFVEAKPGTEHSFRDIYHKAMPQFRSEPGVINYQLSQLADDSTQFVTYEKFRSEDAFQYHLKFPPIQPVIDYLNTSIKKQPFQIGLHRLIPLSSGNQ